MILIFSINGDFSTSNVINWIDYFDKKFIRLNNGNFNEKNLKINITNLNNNLLFYNNKSEKIIIDEIKSIWYRRSYICSLPNFEEISDLSFKHTIEKHLKYELNALRNGIYYFLDKKKWLNKPINSDVNKIESLIIAKQNGLKIPDTIITNSKNELLNFLNKHKKIIVKNINRVASFNIKNNYFSTYTTIVRKNVIDKYKVYFFPSIFQEMLQKEYEIRVFYLNEKIFSMAIFSQSNRKTKIDFRKISKKPNRTVPYILPIEIEKKIRQFMIKMNLNCGSLDFVKTKNDYIFLEVNPVGQFGMVSYPCNYNLEKIIADFLIN